MEPRPGQLRIDSEVAAALKVGEPVVALESTVLAHGLPFPLNIETARACEEAVRASGAIPATIGVVEGTAAIGLSRDELDRFARGRSPDDKPIEKVSLSNLAGV